MGEKTACAVPVAIRNHRLRLRAMVEQWARDGMDHDEATRRGIEYGFLSGLDDREAEQDIEEGLLDALCSLVRIPDGEE